MRLEVLYKPKAGSQSWEYCSRGYVLNLRNSCAGSCRYCYAPSAVHKHREDYHQAGPLKKNLMSRLERDLAKIGPQSDPIFMSFVGDPFESQDGHLCGFVNRIHESGNRIRFLTKRSIDAWFWNELREGDEVGVSLTTISSSDGCVWEPGTAIPRFRVTNLLDARHRGLLTFVSCEPVIDPAWTMGCIEYAAPYCDVFAVGCSNHLGKWDWPSPEEEARVRGIDWRRFFLEALDLTCNRVGKPAYFKRDLLNAADIERSYVEFATLDAAIDASRKGSENDGN